MQAPNHGYKAIFIMLGLLAIAAFITLDTVTEPKPLMTTPTPWGYTKSLTLFIFPVLALAVWATFHHHDRIPRKAMWITIGIFAPLGFLLDIFLGLLFFKFPNEGATLGFRVYGFDWETMAWVKKIPIEEFGFYAFGIAFVVSSYVWMDEHYLRLYNRFDYQEGPPGIIRINWAALAWAIVLIVAGIAFKKFGPDAGDGGFPGWFIFQVLVAFLPAALLYNATKNYVNWRAFGFTAVIMLLISVIWEVTLGLPYQWWGFHDEQMLGIYVYAWSRLPIEEPLLWIMVSFTCIIFYEALKLYLSIREHQDLPRMQVLLPPKSEPQE
ncbi:MAG: hypothetical protein AAGA23_07240 [Pseudomonadota bacterium]